MRKRKKERKLTKLMRMCACVFCICREDAFRANSQYFYDITNTYKWFVIRSNDDQKLDKNHKRT